MGSRPYYGGGQRAKSTLDREADKLLRKAAQEDSRRKGKLREAAVAKMKAGERLSEAEVEVMEELLKKGEMQLWGDGERLDEDVVKELLRMRPKDLKALDEVIDEPETKRNSLVVMQALKLKAQYTLTEPRAEGNGDAAVQVVVNTLRRDGYAPEKGQTTFTVTVPQKQLRRGDEDGEEQV